MSQEKINFGAWLQELRTSRNLSQRTVSDKLGIDISLLSKIEHGERQVQAHMLKPISEIFKLNYKKLQIQFLNQKIEDEYGDNPYFVDTINFIYNRNKGK